MRTHEERMAEIRRRSEEQIKLRKKRSRRILMACIPLVMCIGILGAWLLTDAPVTESMPREKEAFVDVTVEETIPETMEETLPVHMVDTATLQMSHSDYPGLSVEILSVEQGEEGTSLRVLWKNETEKDVIFGSSFFIEELQGGQWGSCAVNETVTFDALAYILEPGAEREKTYRLTGVYDLPEEGTCRFLTECFVYETPEDSLKCEMWAVFNLE